MPGTDIMNMNNFYRPLKDVGVADLCWLVTFVGLAGVQHFYLGRPVRGIIWLLTWGLLGLGTLYDLFALPGQVRDVNRRLTHGFLIHW